MATITIPYQHITTFDSAVDCFGDIRANRDTLPPSTDTYASIGGADEFSGTNYLNTIFVKLGSLPTDTTVKSATLSMTNRGKGSDTNIYNKGSVNMTFYGCSAVTNSTTGANMPTLYSATTTGVIPEYPDDGEVFTFDITAPLNDALQNGSNCIYIYAVAGENRKAISKMSLIYETDESGDSPMDYSVRYNKQPVTSNLTWKQQLVSTLRVNGIEIFYN